MTKIVLITVKALRVMKLILKSRTEIINQNFNNYGKSIIDNDKEKKITMLFLFFMKDKKNKKRKKE